MTRKKNAARDYVEGMWLMLQQPTPEDFVLATGETHRVREFVNKSFSLLGIDLKYVFAFLYCSFFSHHLFVQMVGPGR